MITTIIIPVLNRYDLLTRCLESIPASVRQILVIDNGDAFTGPVDERVRVLRLPTNLGVAASWNLGIKLYPHEPGWLLLNSDAWFVDDAFSEFSRDCGEGRVTLGGSPPWCCAWIGADVVDRVGLFAEVFYPAYMEDVDYEERCRILRVPVVLSAARVNHDNSSTIHSDAALRLLNDQTHQANVRAYQRRWSRLSQLGVPLEQEWQLETRRRQAWDTPRQGEAA